MDNELTLFDRLSVIRETDKKWGLRANAYLSFSGGKDSTILHYLLDEALPGNRIPRVFIDTGIEYLAIRKFVMGLAEKDDRFAIIKPTKSIKQVLETYGYPFKSKEHARILATYQRSGMTKSSERYLDESDGGRMLHCPKMLRYQFSPDFKLKISDQCCLRLKKTPVHQWEDENGRPIAITGMRRSEGGERASIKGCILTDKAGNLKRFHPLLVVSDGWEEWYIKERGIELCELYREPFNFKRTGCKGCPFSLDLQEQLSVMEKYLPGERAQCEAIWKPVYDEYRRLGYRLDKEEQMKLF